MLWWSDSLPDESRDLWRRRRLLRDDSETRDTSLSLSELCRLRCRCLPNRKQSMISVIFNINGLNGSLMITRIEWGIGTVEDLPAVRSRLAAGIATFHAAGTSLLTTATVTTAATATVRTVVGMRYNRRVGPFIVGFIGHRRVNRFTFPAAITTFRNGEEFIFNKSQLSPI